MLLRFVSAYVVTIIFTAVLFLLGVYLMGSAGPRSSEVERHLAAITVTVIPVFLSVLFGVYVIPSRMRRVGSWILVLAACLTYCWFWFAQVRPYVGPGPVLPMLPDIAIAGAAAALFYQRRRPSKASGAGDAFE